MEITQEIIDYYENKAYYFRNIGFEHLAEDYFKIVEILKTYVNKGKC